jgi:hypothetical protein
MVMESIWHQGQAYYKVLALYNKDKTPFEFDAKLNFDDYANFMFVTNQSYKPSQLKEPTNPIIKNNIAKIKSLFIKFLNSKN